MAQAKTLTTTEIERLLTHINTRRFAQRNRAMMLLTHLAGLRIGEVACLRWSDVMNIASKRFVYWWCFHLQAFMCCEKERSKALVLFQQTTKFVRLSNAPLVFNAIP